MRNVYFRRFHDHRFNKGIVPVAADYLDRKQAFRIQPQVVAVDVADCRAVGTGDNKAQVRASVLVFIPSDLGSASCQQCADVLQRRPGVGAVHALAARTLDQRIAGAKVDTREMGNAERPQFDAPGGGAVDQHGAIMRTEELHAHEAGLAVVVADMLPATARGPGG